MKKEYESVLVEDLRDQFKAFGEALQMTGERLEARIETMGCEIKQEMSDLRLALTSRMARLEACLDRYGDDINQLKAFVH